MCEMRYARTLDKMCDFNPTVPTRLIPDFFFWTGTWLFSYDIKVNGLPSLHVKGERSGM